MDITLLEIKKGTRENLISLKTTITDYLRNRKFNNNCITLVKTLQLIDRELYNRNRKLIITKEDNFIIKRKNKITEFIDSFLNDEYTPIACKRSLASNKLSNDRNTPSVYFDTENKKEENILVNKVLKDSSKFTHFLTMKTSRKDLFIKKEKIYETLSNNASAKKDYMSSNNYNAYNSDDIFEKTHAKANYINSDKKYSPNHYLNLALHEEKTNDTDYDFKERMSSPCFPTFKASNNSPDCKKSIARENFFLEYSNHQYSVEDRFLLS